MIHALHGSLVDRYFADAVDRGADRRLIDVMFARIWRCAACRSRYERQLLLERALPDGSSRRDERLWQTIARSADAVPAAEAARPRRAVLALASLALAAVVLLPLWPKSPARVDPVPRGAVDEQPAAPRLHLFRTVNGKSEPIDGEIGGDDGLLIAYSNPSSDLAYLMVFALDQRGEVHWYYPGYERLGQDPEAVPIRTQALGVELGEEIRHHLPPGDLRVFALFLPRPRHVLEIEASVAHALADHHASVADLSSLALPEGSEASTLLKVRP